MKVNASVLLRQGGDWATATIDLDPPKSGEVLVRMEYAGFCRSDDHRRHSGSVYPLIGGHEGAGVVEDVGAGVDGLRPGDHVILSVLPMCGRCKFCASGRSRLCDLGAFVPTGQLPDGTYRARLDGEPLGGFCMVGSFAERVVVSEASCVKIEDWFPLDVAALLSCGVPTGWGSAEYAGEVRAGQTVMVIGSGGVGINAVQASAHLGASHVIVVDPVPFKREFALTMGATHTAASIEEGADLARSLGRGVGADVVIVTVGVMQKEISAAALEATTKGGRLVVTATADDSSDVNIQIPGNRLSLYDVTLRGALFGSCNSHYDIPRLARLYDEGHLKLNELITRQYAIDEVAEAYQDVRDGKVIRGVLRHSHA
jgi:alcohol dehydrogenase (nicotinoprotein)